MSARQAGPRDEAASLGMPTIYCLHVETEGARRERMERRFAHHGLSDNVNFLVSSRVPRDMSEEGKARAGRACFESHLKAMREMLDDPGAEAAGAIIFEDDVLLHNQFPARFAGLRTNLSAGAPLCLLGYHVSEWSPDSSWAGRNPERMNLFQTAPGTLWGTHAYWISTGYARRVLDRYGDLQMEALPNITERITHDSGGYASYPPLVLEEAFDSTIRPPEDLEFHIWGQGRWRYEDYSACEEDHHLSPLAQRTPESSPTIGLCMIVRDEADVIERCLESVKPLIDTWTICDTGSTDATPELVEEALRGLAGRLQHTRWRNFGANRTELMELARGSADYLLLLDADMTLESRGPLPPLGADAYALRHGGDLDYAVPRLVRGDRRWWYEGSTHEYLATAGAHTQEELRALSIRHHGDSGTRAEKLTRDAALLEQDLARDPNDGRATFYLAQTRRDSGDVRGAIELYRRRVELPGWDEEVFYAAYQAGVLLGSLDPEAAVPLLLDAFERRPSRAEPLHELSRLCRLKGRHGEAYEYAQQALEIPYPDDLLFVHRDIYQWGSLFEYAIGAYWAGDIDESLAACEELLGNGAVPWPVERAVGEIRGYCLDALPDSRAGVAAGRAERLAVLAPSLELGEIRLDVDPAWPQFNPTIAADGEGFRLVVRTSNYLLEDGRYVFLEEDGVIRTLNYLVNLDASLELTDVSPLVDETTEPLRHPSSVEGYEDCRLIEVNGEWLALATVRDRNAKQTCEIAMLRLDGSRISSVTVLAGPTPGRHEKNWMPFLSGGNLHVIYTCGPTLVLEVDPSSGELTTVSDYEALPMAEAFRGGSQGLPVEGGHLFVVHEALEHRDRRGYVHRFVLIDRDLRLSAVSPRFRFTDNQVEICAGLARRGNELIASFGASDRAAGLAVCDAEEILGLLEPASTLSR